VSRQAFDHGLKGVRRVGGFKGGRGGRGGWMGGLLSFSSKKRGETLRRLLLRRFFSKKNPVMK